MTTDPTPDPTTTPTPAEVLRATANDLCDWLGSSDLMADEISDHGIDVILRWLRERASQVEREGGRAMSAHTDPTTTPTPTEPNQDARERVRAVLVDAARHESFEGTDIDHLTDAVLAAVSAAAPDERATDPLIVSAIRRHPSGTLRYEPASGPATGTSGRSFLAEYDAALAARPAPAVNAADVRAGVLAACWPNGDALDGISARTADLITASVMRHLGLTVADEPTLTDKEA